MTFDKRVEEQDEIEEFEDDDFEEVVELIDLDEIEDEEPQPAFGLIELHPRKDETNLRLDKFVAERLTDISRSYIQQLIEAGEILVDGRPRRVSFKMTPGEVVTVNLPEPVVDELLPEAIPLSIVYEDADIVVIDKMAGMVVHPAPGHLSGTLANAVLAHAPEIAIAGSNRPGIVHRLDKDTSGLIVVAKTDRARVSLVKQWNSKTVEKGYLALVHGVVPDEEATIDVPVGRDPIARNRMAAVPGGRPAVTHFRVLERFEEATLLDVAIDTGRTHQIRVHLAFIGHPVVGDGVYNRYSGPLGGIDSMAPRQFLHAARLGLKLPDGTEKVFESALPNDLSEVLERLRGLNETSDES